VAALAALASAAAMPPSTGIIPAPAQCEPGPGRFEITEKTQIYFANAADAASSATFLRDELRGRSGLKLSARALPKNFQTNGAIILELAPGIATNATQPEGYSLAVSSNHITLRARSAPGLFHGVQSLLQAASANQQGVGTPIFIPAASITDAPRFEWRGLMLDESRHFFGKQTVKDLLDVMALLKLNRFHWHLTDEPGWRIEIKKYPKLTSIGGRGNWSNPAASAAYYSQADIREIVAYAAQRHILVVPEIDMPGHATAACRAYPEHSGGGAGQWTGFTFNPAREETYQFLEQVLREVAALFPGPYIHLGGDEVHYGNQSWSTNPQIVKFTHNHGMTNAAQVEQYFVRRMTGVIQRLGKTTMGWDEIAGAGVPQSGSVVMWWRHDRPQVLTQLLAQDYRVVLCPRLPCYFDFAQDESHQHGRRWKGAFNTLTSTYQFPEPVTDGLIPAGREGNVLGLEACVWTERIQNRERMAFMTFPRLAALAEAAWTPAAAKDITSFTNRLPVFLRELERRRIPYFNPLAPAETPEPPGPEKKAAGTANG
jgi:hexosaminidase